MIGQYFDPKSLTVIAGIALLGLGIFESVAGGDALKGAAHITEAFALLGVRRAIQTPGGLR